MTLHSCVYRPSILPLYQEMQVSPYGSYITLVSKTKHSTTNIYTQGELIAQEQNKIYVLTKKKKLKQEIRKLEIIEQKDILRYKLTYAKDKLDITPYVVIPVVLTHGFFMLITLPINIVSGIILDASAANEFSYSEKNINFKDLYLFARFPQGLPIGYTADDL